MTTKTLFDEDLTLEEAEELIKNGEDVNQRNHIGRTPLFYVQNVEVAELFIKLGANVNEENARGMTPLFYVNNFDIAQLLIKHGANVNHSGGYNRTPIFNAKNIEIAKLLIDNHAELNLFDIYGLTPLNTVNHASSANMLKLLIENGANLNISNIYGLTLLDQWSDSRTTHTIINSGAIYGKKENYQIYRHLFTKEQQEAFDTFLTLTSNDKDFFQMCLAYQNDQKNHVKIEIKDMDIL